MRRFCVVAVILLFARLGLCQHSTPAFTNDDSNNHEALKIGYFLEGEFSPYFYGCTNHSPMTTKQDGKTFTVSTVPVPILNALGNDVWNYVYNKKTYTAAAAFSVITSDKTLPETPNSHYQLGLNVLQDSASMLQGGTSSVLYSSNCTAIIGGAASVDVNLKFSPASLSSAVQADYQSSNTGELGMIKGDFNSPFFQMYSGMMGGVPNTYSHMLLWDWYWNRYKNQTSIPDESFYALGWFNGISMYQVSKSQRNKDGSVNISGGANYLNLVSVTASLKAQFSDFGSTSVTNYAFAIRAYGGDHYRFDPLDKPSQIAQWFKEDSVGAQLNKPSTFSPVLSQSSPDSTTHEQVISGVPSGMCDHARWTIDPATTANVGSFAVSGERPILATSDQPIPGCALRVSFMPDSAVWSMASGSVVNVKYSLVSKIADQSIVINATQIPFQTSKYPSLQPTMIGPAGFDPKAMNPGPGTNLEWSFAFGVIDDPSDPIDKAAPVMVVSQPSLSNCQKGAGPIGILPGNAGFNNGQLAFKIDQFFSSSPTSADPTNVTCNVSATFRFKTGKGNDATAALPPDTAMAYPLVPKPVVSNFTITKSPQ